MFEAQNDKICLGMVMRFRPLNNVMDDDWLRRIPADATCAFRLVQDLDKDIVGYWRTRAIA